MKEQDKQWSVVLVYTTDEIKIGIDEDDFTGEKFCIASGLTEEEALHESTKYVKEKGVPMFDNNVDYFCGYAE